MNVDTPIIGEYRREAEELCEQEGAKIPGDIHAVLWSLPLLKVLVKRLEEQEGHIFQLQDRLHRLENP